MWYIADGDITWQQNALMVSRVPFLRTTDKEKKTISEECLKALFSAPGKYKRGIGNYFVLSLLTERFVKTVYIRYKISI